MRGISRALWEEARYRSTGELATVSMMTYTVPAATRLPEIETEQVRIQAAEHGGDADPGGMAAAAAIANAVADALRPLGIRHLDMPYTPARVWEAIRRANQGAG
jgi:aerobic carbon-monoxide dehydrogenase large subunit